MQTILLSRAWLLYNRKARTILYIGAFIGTFPEKKKERGS